MRADIAYRPLPVRALVTLQLATYLPIVDHRLIGVERIGTDLSERLPHMRFEVNWGALPSSIAA